jgi:hypothetical protein
MEEKWERTVRITVSDGKGGTQVWLGIPEWYLPWAFILSDNILEKIMKTLESNGKVTVTLEIEK